MLDFFEVYKDLKLITINGVQFLGVFETDGKVIHLTAALKRKSDYMLNNIDDWVMQGNLSLLQTYDFTKIRSYNVSELCDISKGRLEIRMKALKQIKKKALLLWENELYKEQFK